MQVAGKKEKQGRENQIIILSWSGGGGVFIFFLKSNMIFFFISLFQIANTTTNVSYSNNSTDHKYWSSQNCRQDYKELFIGFICSPG